MRILLATCFVALVVAAVPAQAQTVEITFENLQPDSGFYLTPAWVGVHDGTFDIFDSGAMASAALETLAEEGDASGLVGEFAAFGSGQDEVFTSPGGFAGAPVIDPGESVSRIFNLDSSERFLSFASMIIPSNDGFFANDSGTEIEILDANGNFSFAGPIEFTLADLYDSGTELNDTFGAPFSTIGGNSTDTNDPIALHAGLANFDGTDTPDGTTIDFAAASASPVFRLTVTAVPEPGSLSVLAMVGGAFLMCRRRRS